MIVVFNTYHVSSVMEPRGPIKPAMTETLNFAVYRARISSPLVKLQF